MKAIKKALALCLALAMVVTAVPVSTADAAVKTAKLSKSSVTVAGNATKKQTKSVKVTTNADWKNVKVTASSADKKVATVKVSKKTVKVTAVKKGETKVTVKVTGKKSGKNVSKKLTLKVTVCGAGLAVKAPAELTVGDTAKLAVKTTPSTASCTFDVDKKEVATVSDNGTITAVAAGTAKVVVRTDYGKEKVVTVTVKEATASAFTVDAKPVAANTVELAFSRDVAADATVTVQKEGLTTTVDGKATIEGKAGKFVASANFPTGKYNVTVKEGEVESKGTFEITAQKAAKIEVTSTTALTDNTKRYAYVYYKVYDQYGTDITAKTSVDVNTSAPNYTLKRADGKIKLDADSNGNGATFRYNDLVTVCIIDTANGIVCTKSLNVGMEQSVDAVEFAGFISVNDTSKIVDSLPVNFSRDTWMAVYRPLDQDGNYVDVNANNFKDNLTVTADAPLLINSTFKNPSAVKATLTDTYTINGVDYEAFFIQPGMYTDKGGTVTLSIISGKTGKVTPVEVKIGAAAVLQSLVLNNPGTVCDSDKDVNIPFTATTTDGNTTTDYEAIVRSTNELTLTASVGTLVISENADGSAAIKWTDDGTRTYDNVDRPVILTTVVVGGTSNYMTMNVSDYALPQRVKSVNHESVMVVKGTQLVNFGDDNAAMYVDQYGREMKGKVAKDHMANANGDAACKYKYRLAIETANSTVQINNVPDQYGDGEAADTVAFATNATTAKHTVPDLPLYRLEATGAYNMAADTDTFKFTIESTKKSDTLGDKFAALDDPLTWNVTVVNVNAVKGMYIDDISTVRVQTAATQYDSGLEAVKANALEVGTAIAATVETQRDVKVFGKYNGVKVQIPVEYFTQVNAGSLFAVQAKLNYGGAHNGEVKDKMVAQVGYIATPGNKVDPAGLYDFTNNSYTRKIAKGDIKAVVSSVSGNGLGGTIGTLKRDVKYSDEKVVATTIKFYKWGSETTATDIQATNLNFTIDGSSADVLYRNDADYERWGKKNTYTVFDQYGDVIKKATPNMSATYSVKDLEESTSALTHDVNGFDYSGNGSASVLVEKAEITDKFNLVVSVGDIEATLAVTMAGDKKAQISNVTAANTDKDFRQDYLHYYKNN